MKESYKVYFDNGNEAMFDADDFWSLVEFLNSKKDYYKNITKIEKIDTPKEGEIIWGLYDEATGRNYPIGDIIEVYAYLEAYKKRLFEMSILFKDYPMIEKTYLKEDLTYPICNSIEEFLNEIFC